MSGSEIVELGIQIEINGRDFYDVLTRKTQNQKAKEAFEFLRKEEEKHIKAFESLLSVVQDYKPKEAYTEDYFKYMNSLASDHVFTKKEKGKEAARVVKDDNEAINVGIGFEQDSIEFYGGMKNVIPDEDKKLVDKLIDEEKKHLEMLEGLRNWKGGA